MFFPKLWSIGKVCLFTMRVDKLFLNTIEINLIGWKQKMKVVGSKCCKIFKNLPQFRRILP